MNYIEKINEVFALNRYTDGGRVTVKQNGNAVEVAVLGKTEVIDCEHLTDYGVIMEVVNTVDRLYNAD